jgi:hypothetical protein
MEVVLLTVTLASLATAIGTSFLAWRVMRADRLRSEARIAALAADLGMDDRERPERLRPQAAAVSAPVIPAPVSAPIIPATVSSAPDLDLSIADETAPASDGMFAVRPRGRSTARVVAGVGIAAAIVALVIGTLVLTSDRSTSAHARRPAAAAAPAPAATTAADVPLALIALGHEREKDRLTVRGVVRGTATAASDPLTAVVLLFNREGSEIGSGRAEVAPAGPDPAGDRTFVITVPSAGDVGRYRISFRSADHVVPHVDRRAQPGTAKQAVLNVANSQF